MVFWVVGGGMDGANIDHRLAACVGDSLDHGRATTPNTMRAIPTSIIELIGDKIPSFVESRNG